MGDADIEKEHIEETAGSMPVILIVEDNVDLRELYIPDSRK